MKSPAGANGDPAGGAWPGEASQSAQLLDQFQVRLRTHLERTSTRLVQQMTGLELKLVWTPHVPLPANDGAMVVAALAPVWRMHPHRLVPALSEAVWRRHLQAAFAAGRFGHRFTGPAGAAHFWCALELGGYLFGLAHVQAPGAAVRPPGKRAGAARRRGKGPGQRDFQRSLPFLRLVLHDAIMSTLAECPTGAMDAGAAAAAPLPPDRDGPEGSTAQSRGAALVRWILDRVEGNLRQPVTLKSLAKELGMNAAYLSDLFRQHVGESFKRYQTRLRLQKAVALLQDPLSRVAAVGFAVGYADPNQFRRAFKAWSGRPPSVAHH